MKMFLSCISLSWKLTVPFSCEKCFHDHDDEFFLNMQKATGKEIPDVTP